MILTFTTFLMLYLVVLAPFIKGLMSLGALLMLVSLLMTALIGQMAGSWYAFVLFVVYITGLLVLFSYIMSMSPNSYYTKSGNSNLNVFFISFLFLFTVTSHSPSIVVGSTSGVASFEFDVVQVFSPLSVSLFWIMGVILLIALLMAVTICYKSAKPMRSFIG